MIAFLYSWLKKIAVYSVLITAVIQVMPDESYQKYAKYITGLIFVILLSEPLLGLFSIKQSFYDIYHNQDYYRQKIEMEAAEHWMEELENESNQSQMDP